jgi:hypothetical protein
MKKKINLTMKLRILTLQVIIHSNFLLSFTQQTRK